MSQRTTKAARPVGERRRSWLLAPLGLVLIWVVAACSGGNGDVEELLDQPLPDSASNVHVLRHYPNEPFDLPFEFFIRVDMSEADYDALMADMGQRPDLAEGRELGSPPDQLDWWQPAPGINDQLLGGVLPFQTEENVVGDVIAGYSDGSMYVWMDGKFG